MKACTNPGGHQWTDTSESEERDWLGSTVKVGGGKRATTHFYGQSSTMVHCTICKEIGFRVTEVAEG